MLNAGDPIEQPKRVITVAVSLKMYFTHARTLAYVDALAGIARRDVGLQALSSDLIVLPTYPALTGALARVEGSRVQVGAQDLAAHDEGPYTGEVSGAELAEIGCSHVEVGHAERRRLFGESDAVVAAKTAAALRHGLAPILCVGEAASMPADAAAQLCSAQVRAALSNEQHPSGRIIVAYEPVWAIGAPAPAPTEHAATVCSQLRDELGAELDDFAVLYGGSAGPGLLTDLGTSVDGLFLGRFAHDPSAVADVLHEAFTSAS